MGCPQYPSPDCGPHCQPVAEPASDTQAEILAKVNLLTEALSKVAKRFPLLGLKL